MSVPSQTQQMFFTPQLYYDMNHNQKFHTYVHCCINRHQQGDWGDISTDDKQRNELAAIHHDRIVSAYENHLFRKIFIITECSDNVTTVLYPHEY